MRNEPTTDVGTMGTHELDVARRVRPRIELMDGAIVSDTAVGG